MGEKGLKVSFNYQQNAVFSLLLLNEKRIKKGTPLGTLKSNTYENFQNSYFDRDFLDGYF